MTCKIVFIFCFTLLFFGTIQSQVKKISKSTEEQNADYHIIRVLTYNIFHGERTDGTIDMDLFAEIINEQKPDLVALQEVDKFVARSGNIDIVEELSKRTGMKGYFGKYRDYGGGEFGAAVLSNFPVEEFTTVPAYLSFQGNYKTYNFAKVKIAKDVYIYFSSVHLQHKFPEDRLVQAGELITHFKNEFKQSPLILAGDFNGVPDSEEMNVIFEHFIEADKNFTNTFSTRSALTKKIDYILFPKNQKWKVFETKVICRSDASDHCAVFAVLGFNKQR